LRIRCISETGWFDTATVFDDIRAGGGAQSDQCAIPWPPFGAEQLPEIAAVVAQVPLALAWPACCFTRRYSPVRSGCRRATLA